jgi:hypothetical protein
MLETLIYIAIGCAIGWNFPQPQFAKDLQAKIQGWFAKKPAP